MTWHQILLILFVLLFFWDARAVYYRYRFGGDLLWPLIETMWWMIAIFCESTYVFA